jgi:flavin reductase (DIM6/NTAB) family NADH-FMN oxidoreductase RutF
MINQGVAMNYQSIRVDDFSPKIFELFNTRWFLLTSGDFATGKFNSMTISWGSMGIIWNKPFVQVVVRPTRYTFEFMETYTDFTLCAFSEDRRKALNLLGSRSGRDGNKIKESGLTPCRSTHVSAPSFIEANLVIECKKIYSDIFRPEGFIDPSIENNYHLADYHRIYFGEVQGIRGDASLYSTH